MTAVIQNIIQNVQANAPKIALGNTLFWEKDFNISEIKNLLQDINNEKQHMEGLKLVIAAMSKGRNVAELFTDVVKLIASPNAEVKKMVYIYLIKYAEVEQNASLLAISILQKNVNSTNQLFRAQALRTLSCFRVKMILQVVISCIDKGTKDSSAYVRKTAAHAIGKVFSLDPSQKEVLVECIAKLLSDRAPMVLGSAVAAFEEVCPDRYDLIHPNFRKFCEIIIDVDEWGQVIILSMLTRYGRSQFVDPDKVVEKTEEENVDDGAGDGYDYLQNFSDGSHMDPDHRLLLDSVLPLLRSRNAAVVQGVAMMYYYLAPYGEKNKVAKALVRAVRNNRETQFCLLTTIRAIATKYPELFQPFLSEFYIDVTDPIFIRKLKIEILTLLSVESNIDRILREFTYYTTREDKEFVAEVIQAIGKCAVRLPEVTDRCMMQLMQLLGSKSQAVVAEAVVIIKQLLQMPQNTEGSQNDDVIKQLTRLFNKVKNPKARASIIWVVGEYVDKVSSYAPDILRQLAKEFAESDDIVKHQILNLCAKLIIKNPTQTALIGQYIFNLSRYDINYDIRDKSRMMRHILCNPQGKFSVLNSHARQLYITTKPTPNIPIPTHARFTIGSLAQLINQTTASYNAIPDWQETVQNTELRGAPIFETPTLITEQEVEDWPEGEIDEGGEEHQEGEEWEGTYTSQYQEGEYEREEVEEEDEEYEGGEANEEEYEEYDEEDEYKEEDFGY